MVEPEGSVGDVGGGLGGFLEDRGVVADDPLLDRRHDARVTRGDRRGSPPVR